MEDQFVSDGKFYAAGKLFDGHYRLIRQLNDRRASVIVWLARDLNTIDREASANDESSGKLVTLVICRPTIALDLEDEQRWQDEFDAAYDCRHPNLLPPEEYAITDDIYYLVFPYNETNSLRQFIGKNMPEKTTWKLVSNMASGLNELHAHQPQIIHGDIKPSNILVFDNEDFALSNYGIHFESDQQRINNHNASMAYMAPERFRNNAVVRPESDIWALGATLYEVLTGRKPFGVEGGKNQQDNTPMPPLPDQSVEIRDLVHACLQADPKKRPTAQQIKDAARSKKFLVKPRKKNQVERTKEPSGNNNNNYRKKKSVAIAAVSLLLLGVLAYFLIPRRPDNSSLDNKNKDEGVEINYCEKVENLLLYESTSKEGKELLDSLVKEKDWQATYLLSRLYFDTRGKDTVFYDKHWEIMRSNYGVEPNNAKAHEYLFDAFKLKENDFMILYQLGRDFKAGPNRGCERRIDYALWCFNAAEELLNSTTSNYNRYQDELDRRRKGLTEPPLKPSEAFTLTDNN